MMVYNNDVTAAGAAIFNLLVGDDAVVHSDDQFGTLRQTVINPLLSQSITFVFAVRNMGKNVGRMRMEGFPDNGCGANAIHVVVTVNGNRVILLNVGADEANG